MRTVFLPLFSALLSCLRRRAPLQVENLALRHQINVLRRGGRRRLPLKSGDRQAQNGDSLAPQGLSFVCIGLGKAATLVLVDRRSLGSSGPDRKDEPGQSGLESTAYAWGITQAGIELSQTTVANCMVRQRKRLRTVQPAEVGAVIELPQVGGLHHRYERRAA